MINTSITSKDRVTKSCYIIDRKMFMVLHAAMEMFSEHRRCNLSDFSYNLLVF